MTKIEHPLISSLYISYIAWDHYCEKRFLTHEMPVYLSFNYYLLEKILNWRKMWIISVFIILLGDSNEGNS